jgi:3-phosphoshikimate 1-carboxyvinyltransferase
MKSGKHSVRSITPIPHPLAARVNVPGSKSHTNRALLISSLANGSTTLQNALLSEDTHFFFSALSKLGFDCIIKPDKKTITIKGLSGAIPENEATLFIGNAGTAARFLTAMLTIGNGEYTIDGVPRMRQRPIGDLLAALNNLEGSVTATSPDEQTPNISPVNLFPPINIHAEILKGGATSIRGNVSSQFISALLMAAPYAEEEVEISVEGVLNSKPYVDLTLVVMADFGVDVHRDGYSFFRITPQRYQSPGKYTIESDASAASYFFAAPAICGGWVEVENITRMNRQGDIAFLDILTMMGCAVDEVQNAIRITQRGQLKGVDIDMADISDTSITLAALAPFARTPTRIRGIASSRLKESDRVTATCTELRRLGVRIEEHHDGMTIYPCEFFQPCKIRTYDDHRLAMAFSLVGLRIPGIEIENPGCVAKTFPNYFDVLDSLR